MIPLKVLLTGATGYIGSAVAAALARNGHTVLALSRSPDSDKRLAGKGYEVVRGDIREPKAVAELAASADAVVHAATTNDAEGAAVDTTLLQTLLARLEGTQKPLVYTSGVWSFGNTGEAIPDEDSPAMPLPLVAWRIPVEDAVRASAKRGVRGVVVRPGIVYGEAGGIPAMLAKEARETGTVRVVNTGRQEWSCVYVHDLADLYVRALTAPAGSVLHGVSGPYYAVRDLAVAASIGQGKGGKVQEWPLEEARKAFGGFGDALALHERVSAAKTRRLTGWSPTGPSILEELLLGSYARKS
ncbi:MAG TPA: NAD-dependent epimerase/dehydratase family protein [Candidatus Thermoplasmatota archaeon]|nr:NAD-dependent epimerase/dehydratase family protein [Candidatus Thermoplasmatota archaeon]